VTNRTLPAVAALLAAGAGAMLGALVAERMRERHQAPRAVAETPAELLVLERPADEPPPTSEEIPSRELENDAVKLRLRLRADPSGEPVAMRVRLWRLGVPEDAEWSGGDEMRSEIAVPEEGVTFEDLPPGRYRIQCLNARNLPDPPDFEIAKGANAHDVDVPVRRWFRVRLRIVDEDGEIIRRSMKCRGRAAGGGSSGTEPWATWARPRAPRAGDPPQRSPGGSSLSGDAFPEKTGPIVSADGEGWFDLGSKQEPRRGGYGWSSWDFRAESRADVWARVDHDWGVDSTLIGVAPSNATLLARVVLPNGTAVDPVQAEVVAVCIADRHPSDPPADAWRRLPVKVKVTVPECKPLEFVWTAAKADAEHVLVPLPPRALK
jgi:hypothetical protein